MSCPLYGDGSLWGDGDLWCRLYGSSQYVVPIERQANYIAIEVAHSGSDFYIDRLTLDANIQHQIAPEYIANFDIATGERVAAEVSFSGAEFRIDSLRLLARLVHKHTAA